MKKNIMKTNKIIVAVAVAVSMLLGSCHNDLNIVQNNKLTASNMWIDESDATSAANGLYYYMRETFKNNYTNAFYWGELRAGMWGKGTNRTLMNSDQIDVVSSTMSASNASADWTALYTTINMANLIIKHVPSMGVSDPVLNFSMGNAYFVRAFCYFWIARIWGDAPLCLEGYESTSQDLFPVRSPKAQVYAQVESDIIEAEKYVGSTTDKYLASKDALAMLKTEYALWMYTNQNAGDGYLTMSAASMANITLSTTKLEDDFSKVFSTNNKAGKEVIFALHQQNGESVGGYATWLIYGSTQVAPAYRNNPVPVNSNQWFLYNDDFVEFLKSDSRDKRIAVSYQEGNYGADGGLIRWANKFTGSAPDGTVILDDDFLFYRYAQAYLFDAEIKYYQKNYSGALAQINVIAKRAYNVDNYYTDASASAVRQALIDENLKEFTCEGNIWWTLLRLNAIYDFNPTLNELKNKTNILLWPITQSSMNKNNNLDQTEGWS